MQNALNALPSIGGVGGSVLVLGTAPTSYIVNFGGALAGAALPLMSVNINGLSGGTNLTAQVAPLVSGSAGLTINAGGIVTLDNSTANVTNRLNDSASISLNGGALNLLGSGTAASSETMGPVTLASGSSTIASANGSGQSATLTAASLTLARRH